MANTATLVKNHFGTYSFNKSFMLYPDSSERIKPPTASQSFVSDTKDLFKPKDELTMEEKAQEYMDAYRKAERIVVINFYTGGSAYRKGIIDSIYRGYNPLNPK